MNKSLAYLLVLNLLASSCLLVGCGKTGALYLPEPAQTPAPEK